MLKKRKNCSSMQPFQSYFLIALLSWVFLALVFTVQCSSNDTEENPFEVEMLGLAPGNTIAELYLNWYSNSNAGNKSFVRIFKDGELVSETTDGTSGTASNGKIWHKAIVKSLQANTKYKYSVSNNGSDWSLEYDYKTPPSTGAFKFAVVGDVQVTIGAQDPLSVYPKPAKTTVEGWKETVEAIKKQDVTFIVSVGDQVDKTDDGDEREYENFFAPPILRSLPIAPVMGNHDTHDPFKYHFNLPNNSQGSLSEQANYYYLYNNILFVGLNTSDFVRSLDAAESHITRFKATIAAAKAAHPDYKWLIVKHHKSTNSCALHLAEPDIQLFVEAGFEKLMDENKVDFVLAGHDHVYARSYVMKGGKKIDDADILQGNIVGGKGTLYITLTTASGLKYYEVFGAKEKVYYNLMAPSWGREPGYNTEFPPLADGTIGTEHYSDGSKILPLAVKVCKQELTPGYAIFNVSSSGSITVEVYNVNSNQTIDLFTVSK
jgi:hypothetical protein